MIGRVLQYLPDGLVDLINFSSRIASFPPDPRAAEDTEILARRFGFGGTVDGEELRCYWSQRGSGTSLQDAHELLQVE
jgi:hypothetical protein